MGAPIQTFRYRGVFDYTRLYKEGRKYWLGLVDPDDFAEAKYKDKVKECEFKWTITQKPHPYYSFTYKVHGKFFDLKKKTVMVDGEEKEMLQGQARVWVYSSSNKHFKQGTLDGSQAIFAGGKLGKILQKIYERVTLRDFEEDLEDLQIQTGRNYINLLKEICNADFQY